MKFSGKVWVFGDDLNTDAMYPAFAMKMDPPEAAKHIFYEVAPGLDRRGGHGRRRGGGQELRRRIVAPGRVAVHRARRRRLWSPRSSTRCSSATRSTPACPR